MQLSGTSAVVTGAGGGIGKAVCFRLASMGAGILAADINAAAVAKTAEEIRQSCPVTAVPFVMDASDKAANLAMITAASDAFGRVDILVCNAGIVAKGRPIEEIETEEWARFIGINLMGPIFATQAVAPIMKRQKQGAIVYMASVGGQVGGVAASAPYAVTKAGVLCLVKSVARQLAPFQVRVNAVAPGTIRTGMTDILDYDDRTLAAIPLGRIGHVNDVASAVAYLCSEDAAYITGATLDVNGGLNMR